MSEWKRPKVYQFQSAHQNYVRVRWTPSGLAIDRGDREEVYGEDVITAVEYAGPEAKCAIFENPKPSWWPK